MPDSCGAQPLLKFYSASWDPFVKHTIAIAALVAARGAPDRTVNPKISGVVFDFDVDATSNDESRVDDQSGLGNRVGAMATERAELVEADERQYEQEEVREETRRRKRVQASREWVDCVCHRLSIDRQALPSDARDDDEGVDAISKHVPQSIHHEVLHDLILFSLEMGLEQVHSDVSNTSKKQDQNFTYEVLHRKLIFEVAQVLRIDKKQVYMAEKAVAQTLYFIMHEMETASTESTSSTSDLNSSSSTAVSKASSKSKWLRYAGAGAGIVLGGVTIGLTGGLAAPLLAPLLVGATGGSLGFLATSGGAILIGTLFGVAGGGLTGYRVQRRFKGIDEFEFVRVPLPGEEESKSGTPYIQSLHATIVCSGFLLEKNDYLDPWKESFCHLPDRRDVFAIKCETKSMLSAGKSIKSYVQNYVLIAGATEVIKKTVLAAFYSAVALPAAIYKGASMALDNEFQRTTDISRKAGILLADVLETRVQGSRPVILIGSSIGAVTIFQCLLELHERKLTDLVDSVIFISAPISPTPSEWSIIRHVTSRHLINVYSSNDWVLSIIGRLHSLISTKFTTKIAGLQNVQIEGVQDVDVGDILQGHLELNVKMSQILQRVGMCT